VESEGIGHGLSERGGWSRSKRQSRRENSQGRLHRAVCLYARWPLVRSGHGAQTRRDKTPAGPEQYSHGGYEATFGTYEVDENAHTFTFHVEGALVRTLIGKDLPRSFEFSGNQLIVKSTRPDEHWKSLGNATRPHRQINPRIALYKG